jgi:hypothetical protein
MKISGQLCGVNVEHIKAKLKRLRTYINGCEDKMVEAVLKDIELILDGHDIEAERNKPVAKEPAHTSPPDHPFPQHFSCEGCIYLDSRGFPPECNGCCYSRIMKSERKNWTAPAPAPIMQANGCWNCGEDWSSCKRGGWNGGCDEWKSKQAPAPAPKVTDDGKRHLCRNCINLNLAANVYPCSACDHIGHSDRERILTDKWSPKVTDAPLYEKDFDDAVSASDELGRPAEQPLADFIRTLAQRAGERYAIPEIKHWLEGGVMRDGNNRLIESGALINLIGELNDPQSGIKSVTTRADTRPDRGMGEK